MPPSYTEIRAYYDLYGTKQDSQAAYEDPAIEECLFAADFSTVRSVFEFGCGTGTFGKLLLDRFLPPDATYRAVDISPTMVSITRERLAHYGARVAVDISDGDTHIPVPKGSLECVASNYVLDILPPEDIRAFIVQAHRALRPDGQLLLTGLTYGDTPYSLAKTLAWWWVWRLAPMRVGGCRPIELLSFLPREQWRVAHTRILYRNGLASRAVVATPVHETE